jgi:hypothetical protein
MRSSFADVFALPPLHCRGGMNHSRRGCKGRGCIVGCASSGDFHRHERSDRSPLHDVRQPASLTAFAAACKRRIDVSRTKLLQRTRALGRAAWWSQTGSNRRPPACKAGALPTELWPRQRTETEDGRQITKASCASVVCHLPTVV